MTATRIVYYAFPSGAIQGGQKMILRHVETLRDLGFDAVYWASRNAKVPEWVGHSVPIERATPIRPGDIVVLPEDAVNSIAQVAGLQTPSVVFCQNQNILAAFTLDALNQFPAGRPPHFMAVGDAQAAVLRRLFPASAVEVVPCFADERAFRPAAKSPGVAYMPKKRAFEPKVIRGLLRQLHPRHADLPWVEIDGMTESQVAEALGAADLYLSLARFESVGMAALEAMACGCVCAGFAGGPVGAAEVATGDNGFWVPDDDCEAAAEALAKAADLVLTGGPPLAARRDAARETAAAWSYARFRAALEETWTRLAPAARRKSGPLD